MIAEMPGDRGLHDGPSGLGRAHLPDRDVLGRVGRALVGAVVRGHDDRLRARVHERPHLVAERRLEADDGRDLVARDLEEPGVCPAAKSRGIWLQRADAAFEQARNGTYSPNGTRWRLAYVPSTVPSGRNSTLRFSALAPAGRPPRAGASATALASTHACSAAGDGREVVARGTGRCAGRRPCSTPGRSRGRPGRCTSRASAKWLFGQVPVVDLGRR